MIDAQNIAIAAKMKLAERAEAKERAEEKVADDRKTARAKRTRKIARRERNVRIAKTIGRAVRAACWTIGEVGGVLAIVACCRLAKTKRGRMLIAYGFRHAVPILITGRPIGGYDPPVPPPLPKRRGRVWQHSRGMVNIVKHPQPGKRQPARVTAPPSPAVAVRRACIRATTIRKPSPGCSSITVLSTNIII